MGRRGRAALAAAGPAEPASPAGRRGHARWLVPLALFLVAAGVYANTLGNDFTFDDDWLILREERLADPGGYLRYMFLERPLLWRPLKRVTLIVDNELWGRAHPAGFHLSNVLLHGATCLALYGLALRLGSSRRVAAVATLLFAVHPAHVEAVANVSHRKEPMSLLFSLLAFHAYLGARAAVPGWAPVTALGRRLGGGSAMALVARGEALAWTLLFYAAGMMSKEVGAVMLPFAVLAWEASRQGPARLPWRRLAWLAVPFALVLALFTVRGCLGKLLGYFGPEQVEWVTTYQTSSYPRVFLGAVKSFGFYLALALWPDPLYVDRVFTLPRGPAEPAVLLSAVLVAAYLGALAWSRRRAPLAFFGLAWYGLSLLPVSNLVPLTQWPVAERFWYVPSAGLALVAALAVDAPWRGALAWPGPRAQRRAAAALVGVLALVLAVETVAQNRVWRDDLTLWSHTLRFNPGSYRGLYGVGAVLDQAGRFDEAERYYREAMRVEPAYRESYYGLAFLELRQGRFAAALEHARAYLKLDPGRVDAWKIAAHAALQLGRTEQALDDYRRAVELAPEDYDALFHLANAQLRSGRAEAGLETVRRALLFRPAAEGKALVLEGDLLRRLGRGDEALRAYRQALAVEPGGERAALSAVKQLLELGREAEARAELGRLLGLEPGAPELDRALLDLVAAGRATTIAPGP